MRKHGTHYSDNRTQATLICCFICSPSGLIDTDTDSTLINCLIVIVSDFLYSVFVISLITNPVVYLISR